MQAVGGRVKADVGGDRPLGGRGVQRLKRLGDRRLAHPLLALTGDLSAIRSTEAAITEMGRMVLAGEANRVALNGIDDWVGGVHPKARSGSHWLSDGETLIPGHTA